MLRWGFLGASRIGHRVLGPAVAAAAGQTLHAVAARDLARAREFADAFGAPRAYAGYDALLADATIDIVYNALPNDAHLAWTVRALEAGKHVLCEKPLALEAREVAVLQAAEARTGRFVLEAFCYRFHPMMDRMRALLDDGAIGRIVAAHAAYLATIEPGGFRWEQCHGGGSLYDLGCYCASALRLALGREPERVAAVSERRHGVDASASALLDFGDGVAAQFSCSFVGAWTQYLTIFGSRGWITMDRPITNSDRAVTLVLNGTAEEFAPANPFVRMVEHVGRVAGGEEALRFPLAEALGQARTLDAVFRAAASGQVETVEHD